MNATIKIKVLLIFIFVSQLVHSQKFEWANSISGLASSSTTPATELNKVLTDSLGNIYSLGTFTGNVDFNPDNDSLLVSSPFYKRSLFIQKVDSLGSLIWVKTIVPSTFGRVSGIDMDMDSGGNIVIFSVFKNTTIDVDFGPAVVDLYSQEESCFFLKIDLNGNFIWVRELFIGIPEYISGLSITDYQTGSSIHLDNQNSIYLSYQSYDTVLNKPTLVHKFSNVGNQIWSISPEFFGVVMDIDTTGNLYLKTYNSFDSLDVDPGIGSTYIYNNGYNNGIVLVKLNNNGAFSWAKSINYSTLLQPSLQAIETDLNGNVICTFKYIDTLLIESTNSPAIDSFITNYPSGNSILLVKYDSLGGILFKRDFNCQNCVFPMLESDSDNNLYLKGTLGYTPGTSNIPEFDADPGLNEYLLSSFPYFHTVFIKLNSSGNFNWALNYGYKELAIERDNLIMYGNDWTSYINPVLFDADPTVDTDYIGNDMGGYHYSYTIKYSQNDCDLFRIKIDTISNIRCGIDTNAIISVKSFDSHLPISYSWDSSIIDTLNYLITDTPGLHNVVVTDSIGCEEKITVLIEGPVPTFDLVANAFINNLSSSYIQTLSLDVFNRGCQPTDGQLKLLINQPIDTTIFNPPTNGDTVIIDFSQLSLDSGHFNPEVFFTVDSFPVEVEVLVTPTSGDEFVQNNFKKYSFNPQVNAFRLKVNPEGVCSLNYIDTSNVLTYSVEGFHVSPLYGEYSIFDTIDSSLEISSIKTVGSNQPFHYEVINDSILHAVYHKDSASSLSSHLIFEINHKSTILDFTHINNKAYRTLVSTPISGSPQQTNNVTSTYVYNIPAGDSVSLFQDHCDSYVWQGNTYTQSGIYSHINSNLYGCDSTVYLHLTILQGNDTNLYISECDSFLMNSIPYYSSGTYQQSMTNQFGCDSTIFVHLTLNSSEVFIDEEACDSIDINGVLYSESGIYTQNLVSTLGCDSIVNINLIIEKDTTIINQSAIEGFVLNNVIYTNSGQYEQILTNVKGCDSLIILNLEIGYLSLIENEKFIKVYPNPFSNQVIVHSDMNVLSISIINIEGKEINCIAKPLGKEFILETSHLSRGIYFLKIITDENIRLIKVLKESP